MQNLILSELFQKYFRDILLKKIKFANDIINTIMKNVGRLKGLLKGKE